MSYTPEQSPFQLSADQKARLTACQRPDEIAAMMHAFLLENGNAGINADGETELIIGPTPRMLAQTVEVNGEKHIVEVESSEGALGLQKAVTNWYRAQANGGQQRDASGKFGRQQADEHQQRQPIAAEALPADEQELAVATAELRAKLARGELIAEEFLSQKQELENGLKNNREWGRAVELFKQSPSGEDWVGGNENMRLMAQMIDHLDLTTGEEVDSVEKKTAVLAGFWAKMKSSGNYFEPEQSAAEIADSLADEALRDQQQEKYAEELSRAESASQIQEINTRYGFRPERDSSGVFGR